MKLQQSMKTIERKVSSSASLLIQLIKHYVSQPMKRARGHTRKAITQLLVGNNDKFQIIDETPSISSSLLSNNCSLCHTSVSGKNATLYSLSHGPQYYKSMLIFILVSKKNKAKL
jgi:hypothetical protein